MANRQRSVCPNVPIRSAFDRGGILILFLLLWRAGGFIFADDRSASREVAAQAAERRIDQAVRYIASDELEGRGLATKGLNKAAEYLAGEFRAIGLRTELFDGSPFQTFKVTITSKLGKKEHNHLILDAPDASNSASLNRGGGDVPADRELKLGDEFTPLAIGGTSQFDLPLVFAGYGISSKEDNYDDYDGIDAKGKAVIILRHEPQQDNPHGAFDGTSDSRHAPIARKISNAYQHGAEAVILVTDEVEIQNRVGEAAKRYQRALDAVAKANDAFKGVDRPTLDQIESHRKKIDVLLEQARGASQRLAAEQDPLFAFDRGSDGAESRRFAVLHCRRAALDPMIKSSLGATLGDVERQIDEDLKPRSGELTGWRIRGETSIERVEANVKNVVAVLEGEGPSADETIVIGAHYDHLGRGEAGTLATGSDEIHNGADDNGSGTVALLEVARQLAGREKKLPRRVVFIAFTGEERGLLGSNHYVHHPLFPIAKTIAMLNMDMVGRMQNDELIVYGTGTAKEFDRLIDQVNEPHGFKIKREAAGFGPSDHSSFYALKIPVLHFFTGLHNDYHRPTDDANKLNVPGIRRVSEMVAEAAVQIAEGEQRPEFTEPEQKQTARIAKRGDRPYFGSIPQMPSRAAGYELMGVSKGGPAERAGLRRGDVIVRFGDNQIGNLDDFDSALRKYSAGESVPVVVRRDGKEIKLETTLEPPR